MRLLCCILFSLVLFFSPQIQNSEVFADVDVPSDIKIPPAFELNNNLWMASVHQFTIFPLTGQIAVYYTGMFSSSENEIGNKKSFVLPFPKGAKADSIQSVQITKDVQQIQYATVIDTPFGHYKWEKGQFDYLPGVTVILLQNSSAKIAMESADFIHDNSGQSDSSNQYVRVSWDVQTNYPQFEIKHLIPSRIWIYILVGCLALILFSVAFRFVRIRGVDTPI